MDLHLNDFATVAEYNAFIEGDYLKPNVSYIEEIDDVKYQKDAPDPAKEYLTFEALEDGTFQLTKEVNYSLDGGTTWTTLAANTNTPTVTAGNKIMWKGNISTGSLQGVGTFSSTGNFNAEGNPMSLIYGDNFAGQKDLTSTTQPFYRLFYQSNIISASNLILPATTLVERCYLRMFEGATKMTTPPEILPATALETGCYANMFDNCNSLIAVPKLPATTMAQTCYYNMFIGCSSLNTVPVLPATNLAMSCYNGMFKSCTSLTVAPELPATVMAENCYTEMFRGTKLSAAPELPATTLANNCYNNMFRDVRTLRTPSALPATTLAENCYNSMYRYTIIETAPELPATVLANNCYYEMFHSCTNLNSIKMLATDVSASNCLSNWVTGVASTGTFTKAAGAVIPEGASGIPSGWTVVEV